MSFNITITKRFKKNVELCRRPFNIYREWSKKL